MTELTVSNCWDEISRTLQKQTQLANDLSKSLEKMPTPNRYADLLYRYEQHKQQILELEDKIQNLMNHPEK